MTSHSGCGLCQPLSRGLLAGDEGSEDYQNSASIRQWRESRRAVGMLGESRGSGLGEGLAWEDRARGVGRGREGASVVGGGLVWEGRGQAGYRAALVADFTAKPLAHPRPPWPGTTPGPPGGNLWQTPEMGPVQRSCSISCRPFCSIWGPGWGNRCVCVRMTWLPPICPLVRRASPEGRASDPGRQPRRGQRGPRLRESERGSHRSLGSLWKEGTTTPLQQPLPRVVDLTGLKGPRPIPREKQGWGSHTGVPVGGQGVAPMGAEMGGSVRCWD